MTQCKSQYNSCIQAALWCDGGKHTSNSTIATFASVAIVSIGSSVDSNSNTLAFVVHSGVTIVVTTISTASVGIVCGAWRGLGWAIRLLGQQVASCTTTSTVLNLMQRRQKIERLQVASQQSEHKASTYPGMHCRIFDVSVIVSKPDENQAGTIMLANRAENLP